MRTAESFEMYRSHNRYISPSDIKGCRTPKEFICRLNSPKKHTEAFDIGTAFHSAVLEPEKFKSEVVCLKNSMFPNPNKVNQDGSVSMMDTNNREYNKNFREMNSGKLILNEAQYNSIISMREAVMQFPEAKGLLDLNNAYVENCFYARVIFDRSGKFDRIEACGNDELPGKFDVLIKTRPDYVHKNRFYDLDLKSTQSVDPEVFAKDAAEYEYDIQAAMGLDIITCNLGEAYETFLFLAVEKQSPYNVLLFDLNNQDIMDAKLVYLRRLNAIREARNDGNFKGYEIYAENDFNMVTLSMPKWYKDKQQYAKF